MNKLRAVIPAVETSLFVREFHRGRGSVSNRTGRFEALTRTPFDDGWGALDEPVRKLETVVTEEQTRRAITSNDSPDVPFKRSVNPYKGCEHGCAYCFARPTHAYLGLSPGLDFESRLVAKPGLAEALRRELAKPRYDCQTIALGANTDPYQPIERRLRITRSVLELLDRCRHPVSVVTKSFGVTRDLDLLASMAQHRLANVLISITTLDKTTARRLEPRAAAPSKRLEAVSRLSGAGIPVGVLLSPVIPGLTCHEIEDILAAAKAAGASSARTILLRLPLELKKLFEEWLETHYPERRDRVLSLLRQAHGGELYRSTYGTRMTGSGPYAEMLLARFRRAARAAGLDRPLAAMNNLLFRPPKTGQLPLF